GLIAARWISIFEEARRRRGGRARFSALSAVSRPAPTTTPPYDATDLPPAAARQAAMSLAAHAAAGAREQRRECPPPAWATPVVVLPMTARNRFLDRLVSAEAPAYLCLRDPAGNGWHERRGPVRDLASDLLHGRTATLAVEPWPRESGSTSHTPAA